MAFRKPVGRGNSALPLRGETIGMTWNRIGGRVIGDRFPFEVSWYKESIWRNFWRKWTLNRQRVNLESHH
jgi:hypothetical protein